MRILITTRFYRNGQTTHVFTLCQELLRQGHQVFLAISRLDCPNYEDWLKRVGIPWARSADPLTLGTYLKRWQPDLIHNHSAHTLPATIALGRILHIPTLSTIHYLDFAPLELLAQQEAVVLISREMQEKFQHLPVPTYVVENGIPLTPFSKQTPKPWSKRALFLAQVSPEKEENFREMSASLLDWGWEVKSAGNWRYPGVKHLGWVNDVGPVLRQASLAIGTGRAIREGMAAGCLAWVLGEYSDGLVTPGNVALLQRSNFSGRESKKPFCPKAARDLLQKPATPELQTLATFGQRYAREHFSIQSMVENLNTVYQNILENPSDKSLLNRNMVSSV